MSSMFMMISSHVIQCLRTSLLFILLQFPTCSLANMCYLSVTVVLWVTTEADVGRDWAYTEHPSLQ